ncbi:hypothetical protein I2703_004516 [Vibrio alginolyticus]|nr:hypothetical protein [Vibrio alginolyticus]
MNTITHFSVESLQHFLDSRPCNFNYESLLQQYSQGLDQTAGREAINAYIESVVESKFQECVDAKSEASFLSEIYPALEKSYSLPKYTKTKFTQKPLTRYFRDAFLNQLKQNVLEDRDIEMKVYIHDFVDKFATEFSLEKREIGSLNLYAIARRFFPNDCFHSKKMRNERKYLNDYYLERDLSDLKRAFEKGTQAIKRTGDIGKFQAGQLAEDAWFKVIKEHLGNHFDVYQDLPVKVNNDFLSPKIDILVVKKDYSHNKQDVNLDFVFLEDVVAAFEVKRTLKKDHVRYESHGCKEIVEKRCKLIKSETMPKDRYRDEGLTPYQMLRGKVFFGVLSLDVEKGVEELLSSKESGFSAYMRGDQALDWDRTYLYPDSILCRNDFYWSKDTSTFGYDNIMVKASINTGEALIDSSNTHIGVFFSKLRRYLIAQSHIQLNAEEVFLGRYDSFDLLNHNYTGRPRVFIYHSHFQRLDKISEFEKYASKRIPNEYSNVPVHERLPVQGLKCWRLVEAKDVVSLVKWNLKKIIKLELARNYKPLPDNVSLYDDSFDKYIDNLFMR